MLNALRRHDYAAAVTLAQALVASMDCYDDLVLYVQSIDSTMRASAVCLLRDVLNRRPGRFWGIPVLLYMRDHSTQIADLPATLEAPGLGQTCRWMCPELGAPEQGPPR